MSDRQRRWVPQKPGTRPTNCFAGQPEDGVSRFGGQAGTQAPDPMLTPPRNRGSRAGSTTLTLPADYALPVDGEFAAAERHRTASSGAVCPALSFSCTSVALSTAPPARSRVHVPGRAHRKWERTAAAGAAAGPVRRSSGASPRALRAGPQTAQPPPPSALTRTGLRNGATHPTPAHLRCQPPDGPTFRSTHTRRPGVVGQKLELVTP
jgi:hypothetical protein